MSRAKLVSESYDTDISVSSWVSSEIAASESEDDGKSHDSYMNELEERKKYVQEFINKSFQHFKKGLDFGYVHDQDMSYYQETFSYNDDRPMLGPVDDNSLEAVSDDGPDYDPDYDEEVNRLLDEVDKEILRDSSSLDADEKNGVDHFDPMREQYEDYYDEFPEDMHHVGPIPSWYQKMLQKKIKETKSRLEDLSSLVCYACASTGAHIKRMEQDHSTTFCKMDYPRHPPLNKPWTNFWKFNCMIKCKEIHKPNHAHTADCESVLLEHFNTGVSTVTKNICPNEYPKFVMDAVELFQDFAIETTKNVPFLDSTEAKDTVYEKPVWTEMKLRSNYKNELQIVLRGKGVTSLISKLKKYYDTGPGSTSNVVSVYCINQKWSQKKSNFPPSFITGIFKIRDKLGPISINYEPKTSVTFNSVESIQLGKIIEDYAGVTKETTLLDIGCNFGVLSLMMSHRCDRVIGLNTMHFVNSELNQAEELKRNNGVHNVSFMGCDPKDVLTKCTSIVKRSICVAVLNLASPYGKSLHVMQALRDLPTVWRIIIYGSFTKEFHRNISTLTSKDDMMGEHYLPMQGCILDKSPSVEDAFDVIILFERKSLITPSIELFAPGPTVNVKDDSDSYSYGSLEDSQNGKPIIKLERGFGKPDYRIKKFVKSKPFVKYKGPINKFGKFDSPMLPMDKEQSPENSQKKSKERSPSPTRSERKFDCSLLKQKPPLVPAVAQNEKDRAVYPSIRKELQIKELKRIFDSPYLPLPKEEKPTTNGKRSPSPPPKEKKFDCSVLRQEKKFDCSVLRQEKKFDCSMLRQEKKFDCSMLRQEKKFDCSMLRQEKKFDCSMLKQEKKFDCSMLRNQEKLPRRTPFPHPSLSVKKEFQLNCPTPPRESFPTPSSPLTSRAPTGNGFLDASQIKKEKDLDHPSLSNVKAEPMELCDDDKEEGELSPERDDGNPTVHAKPKALDPSYFIGFSAVNCESIAQPVTVKSEPGEAVRIKEEPEDMLSSNPQDIQNMETPIHHPRALDSGYSSTLAKPANFTSVDGHEFSVKPNQSFLPFSTIKKEPKTHPEADEEIEIIDEKMIVAPAQHRVAEPRIRIKSLDDIIKTKNESEQNDDLRTLIEQRKTLQRKLDREREMRCYKDLHGRSPSPDLPRRYKREPSSSPPPPFRKYNRSPSPHKRRSPAGRRSLSPSTLPAIRKYNRSPSPYSRRSPGGRRYKRSPPSPTRQWVKRERSPSPRAWIKRERSLSPPPRWMKRERSPTGRRWRRSPSPSEKRYRRSPSPVRLKREPHSPVRFKRESHSPVSSRWGERSRRSPSSSSSHKSSNKWETYKRAKSPIKSRHEKRKRKSRSRSPAGVKRKCESLSPITSSPSPPRKRYSTKERKKKDQKEKKEDKEEKKKNKSKPTSKSNSPTRDSKKKSKTVKDDSTWDIPAMSTLPSPPKSSDKLEESKSFKKVDESKSSDKVDKSKIPGKLDESKSLDKVDESKSSDKVDESKSSEKPDESKSLDKVVESKSSDKVNKSKIPGKLDESKSSHEGDESKSSYKVDKSKIPSKLDESKSSDKVDESKSSEKPDESKSLDKVVESKSSDKVDKSKIPGKLDESKSSHEVDEPKSSDEVDESKSLDKVDVPESSDQTKISEKPDESKSLDKVDESKSSDKVDKSKIPGKLDESKSSDKVDESKSSDEVDESKSLDKVDESKSLEKIDESKSSDKIDEPKVETAAESASIEQTESVKQECESKSKSLSPVTVIEDVGKSEVTID